MNYVTPATVRALEWIGALVPELPHIYLTSSRDETIDKALRLDRACTRKSAQVAIGLDGGYYGHTCGVVPLAQSDPEVHAGGPGHFAWPRVPHPAIAGTAATIAALRAAVAAAGGPDKILGFVLRARAGAHRARCCPPTSSPALARAAQGARPAADRGRDDDAARTAAGKGAFAVGALGARARRARRGGAAAQTGYLHTRRAGSSAGPLTLVSTWDGDELSLVRQHHQLRAARHVDVAAGSAALDRALAQLPAGATAAGLGAYRVIDGGSPAAAATLSTRLAEHGVAVRRFPNARLGIAPPLDSSTRSAAALAAALGDCVRTLELPAGASPREWGRIHGESFRGEIKALAAIRVYLCTQGRRLQDARPGARRGARAPAGARALRRRAVTTSCSASPRARRDARGDRRREPLHRPARPRSGSRDAGARRRPATTPSSARAPAPAARPARRRRLQRALGRVADRAASSRRPGTCTRPRSRT